MAFARNHIDVLQATHGGKARENIEYYLFLF